jgi:DHA2 family multidrug resistance protein
MSEARRRWWIAAAVSFGGLMGAIDTAIINVALPHLRGYFSATNEEITWVSTVYLMSAAIAMPLSAWLAAWWGRRAICRWGLLLFVAASLACGLADSLLLLVLARCLQGLAAGVLVPVEQIVLRETFPPNQQGLAMGVYGITIMFGPAIGPTLGGYLIDNVEWRWIFLINLPIGLVGYLMVTRFIHDAPGWTSQRSAIDLPGIALLVVALTALHVLLEQGQRLAWFESGQNVVLAFVSAAAALMFVTHELTVAKPVVNLRVLANGAFVSALLISTAVSMVVFATLYLLPIYMQDILGFSATDAGLTLLPRALVMMACFPLVGMVYNKLPARLLIGCGLLAIAASSWQTSRLDIYAGQMDILWPQVLQGIGIACVLTPLSTLALACVERPQLGASAGLYSLARQLGGSLGIVSFASMISTMQTIDRGELVHNVVAGDAQLVDRLKNVTDYFMSLGGIDHTDAVLYTLRRLNGNFELEVYMLAIEHAFQLSSLLLLLLLVPLLFMLRPRQTAPAAPATPATSATKAS